MLSKFSFLVTDDSVDDFTHLACCSNTAQGLRQGDLWLWRVALTLFFVSSLDLPIVYIAMSIHSVYIVYLKIS